MACFKKCCKIPNTYLLTGRISVKTYPVVYRSTSRTSDDNLNLSDDFNSENKAHVDIQEKRDISRLPEHLACRLKHRLKVTSEEKNVLHASVEDKINYDRRLYVKYGKASGVNPAIMWPTLESLAEIIEDEQTWDKPLSQMMDTLEKEKKAKLKAMLEKDKLVEKRMKEMPALIEKYRQHLRDLKAEEERGRQRQNKMLEEAREFFGYDISPRDAQFKAYEENKKEEEAKLLKKQKKEQRIARRKQLHAITGEENSIEPISEQAKQ